MPKRGYLEVKYQSDQLPNKHHDEPEVSEIIFVECGRASEDSVDVFNKVEESTKKYDLEGTMKMSKYIRSLAIVKNPPNYDNGCLTCEQMIKSESDMVLHLEWEHYTKDFPCLFHCGKKFGGFKSLEQHMKLKHSKILTEEEFLASGSSTSSTSIDLNPEEMTTPRRYKTYGSINLNSEATSKSEVLIDLNQEDSEPKENKSNESEQKLSKYSRSLAIAKNPPMQDNCCLTCGLKILNKTDMVLHIETKHFIQDFPCLFHCGKKFGGFKSLEKHMRMKHSKTLTEEEFLNSRSTSSKSSKSIDLNPDDMRKSKISIDLNYKESSKSEVTIDFDQEDFGQKDIKTNHSESGVLTWKYGKKPKKIKKSAASLWTI